MVSFVKKYYVECIFLLFLAILSVLVQYGRIGASVDGIALTTDPGMYASIFAAQNMPEAFTQDAVYSKASVLETYRVIQFPLMEALLEQGKYGLAYLKLTGVHVFLHYLSFYCLGLMLLKKRWQALFFTVIMGQTYWIPWGTYWGGGYLDYTPRSTFSALYGFLLCAVLATWNKERWWPVVLFAAGLMIYVHSISTLPVLVGLWLGYAALKPPKKTWTQHGLWMLVTGACGMLAIAPYVFHYLKPTMALTAADMDIVQEAVRLRFDPEFTDYWTGIGNFFWQYTSLGLFPLGVAGAWYIHAHGTVEEKRRGLQVLLWSIGPLVMLGLFVLDKEWAAWRHVPSAQFDLIRALRFLPFFAICLTLMGLNVLFRTLDPTRVRAVWMARILAVGVGVGFFLGGNSDLVRTSLLYYWNSAQPARYEAAYRVPLERKAMLQALMEYTPQGAKIFYPKEDEAIRHYAHRPLVFAWKDMASLYYGKFIPELREWVNIYKQLQSSPTAYIALAGQTGADYLLSDRPQDKDLLSQAGEIVWESKTYVLVHLRAK